jgi:hypothetical protein
MTAPNVVKLEYVTAQSQYALYDTEKDRWYRRGEWYSKGELPRIFRRKGPMKNSILYLCDSLYGPDWKIVDRLRAEYPEKEYSELYVMARKERIQALPDSYMIYILANDGLHLVSKVKDWYYKSGNIYY